MDDPEGALPFIRKVLGFHDIIPHGVAEDPDHGGRQRDHAIAGLRFRFRNKGTVRGGILQGTVHRDGAGIPINVRIFEGADFTQAETAEHGQEDGQLQRGLRFRDDQLQEGDHFRLRKGRLFLLPALRALHPVRGIIFQETDAHGCRQHRLHAAQIVLGRLRGERLRGLGVGDQLLPLPAGALQLVIRQAGALPGFLPEIVQPIRQAGRRQIREREIAQLREDPGGEEIAIV